MAAQVALCYTVSLLAISLSLFLAPDIMVDAVDIGGTGAAQTLIDSTKSSNVFHLDLLEQQPSDAAAENTPWFDGFGGEQGAATTGAVAVATIAHPIRRMLLHLQREGVGLEEAMSWAERGDKSADSSSSYRQGYQIVDNFLVRALGGKSAWDLRPGDVGKAELQAARVALGKFEVLLRADCLAVDLPLLQPYLATPAPAAEVDAAARITTDFLESGEGYFLELGSQGGKLLRANRWDLQLWDFARDLVESRSTSVESYLCDSSKAARSQRMPGEGRRAVVYNSPSFHITGVAMFSCVLMSLGFDVTAVIKEPGAGFQHLLPCPNRVVTLDGNYLADTPGEILDEETAAALSLPTALTAEQEDQRRRQQMFYEENQRLKKQQEEEEEEELRKQQEQQQIEQQEEQDVQEQEHGQEQGEGGGEVDRNGARQRRERKRRRATTALQGSSMSSPSSSLAGLSAPQDELDGFGWEVVEEEEEEMDGEEGERKEMEEVSGGLRIGKRDSTRSSSKIRGRRMTGRTRELLMMAAGIQQEQEQEPKDCGGGVPCAPIFHHAGGRNAEQARGTALPSKREANAIAVAEAQPRLGRRHRLVQTVGDKSAATLTEGAAGEEEAVSVTAVAKERNGKYESAGNGRQSRRTAEGEGGEGEGNEQHADEGIKGNNGMGPFDLSVLCTAVNDVNHLMKATYPVDPRIADALLWDVDVSIWNIHSVEAAFRSDHRVPPSVNNFARGVPSMEERGGGGRVPPQTFLTLYGEHVEHWERWSEEVYEGWGWTRGEGAEADTPGRGRSTLGGLFRRPGVVYPIHPTGHLWLPRPKRPFASPPPSAHRGLADSSEEGMGGVQEEWENGAEKDSDEKRQGEGVADVAGREEDVVFVVQGNMQSYRRDYPKLVRCLEAMCSAGRENFQLVAVGARGDLPEEMGSKACVEERTTEWRHLEYPEFYANISAGHFVVTAAAGHDYEYDKATSTVPTALLLERPLVMSSTLLDAYPCLRKSPIHSTVANDDLCLNLQAAYDLTTAEYDEMELEARDCKLEMWRHARETVAAMASGWTLDR